MEDHFEHIDDFMSGNLSPDVLALFNKEVEKNASLKKAIENYPKAKKISEGLLELDMLQTLGNLEEIESEPISESKNALNSKWLFILGLLAVIFAIGLSIGKKMKSGLNKDEILASYIKPIDMEATKSIDTIGMSPFEKGKYYFALNRFTESEQWLIQYISKEKKIPLRSRGYYWLGSAHLEQWDVAEAKKAWAISDEKEAKENLKLLEK